MPLKKVFTYSTIFLNKKRSTTLLFLFFKVIISICIIPRDAIALTREHLSTFNQAKVSELRSDPTWLALLQFKNSSPQIFDPEFYINSTDISVENELNTFIDKLYSTDGFNYACRFPARYYWLKNKVPNLIKHNLKNCTELNEFITRAPMSSASVVFASENISTASSMMGHIFFKLHGINNKNNDVNHSISFFTEIDNINFPKLVYESLITGKKGYYALSPYEQSKNHYLFNEQRNIWEYKLKLSEYERELLHYYFFELKNISFTYFFHKFNCATLVQNVIQIIHPDISDDSLWVTPLDVVRKIDSDTIIEDQIMIASSRWKIKAFSETLNVSRSDYQVIETRQFDKLATAADDEKTQFLTYQLALAFNDYQFEKDNISKDLWNSAYNSLQKKKKMLPANLFIDVSNYKRPSKTIQDSQIFISSRAHLDQQSYILGLLPAGHFLSDDNIQYQNESELKIAEISFDFKPKSNSLNLYSLILYSAISLQQHDELTGGLSGSFRIGYEPKTKEDLTLASFGFIEGGLGKTYRLLRDVDISLLTQIKYQQQDQNILGLSPQLNLIVREVYNMKTILNLEHDYFNNATNFINLKITQAFNQKHYSLLLNYYQNQRLRSSEKFSQKFSETYQTTANGFEISLKKYF